MTNLFPEAGLFLGIAAGLLAAVVLGRISRAVARAVWGRQ